MKLKMNKYNKAHRNSATCCSSVHVYNPDPDKESSIMTSGSSLPSLQSSIASKKKKKTKNVQTNERQPPHEPPHYQTQNHTKMTERFEWVKSENQKR